MIDLHGRFVWYELMTTDVRGAMAFYSKVMGWRAWDASTSDRRYILFSAGPASVSGVMELTKEARDLGANSNWLGYVGVDDVDATTERIKSFGGVVHVPPVDAGDISRFSIFSDPQAARLAGIDTRLVKFAAFTAGGALTGLAALMNAVRFNQIPSNAGLGLEMKVVAAVIVGGAAVRGGRGSFVGTLLGVTLLATVGPALVFLGVTSYWERAVHGVIVLAAVAADAWSEPKPVTISRRVAETA